MSKETLKYHVYAVHNKTLFGTAKTVAEMERRAAGWFDSFAKTIWTDNGRMI